MTFEVSVYRFCNLHKRLLAGMDGVLHAVMNTFLLLILILIWLPKHTTSTSTSSALRSKIQQSCTTLCSPSVNYLFIFFIFVEIYPPCVMWCDMIEDESWRFNYISPSVSVLSCRLISRISVFYDLKSHKTGLLSLISYLIVVQH